MEATVESEVPKPSLDHDSEFSAAKEAHNEGSEENMESEA